MYLNHEAGFCCLSYGVLQVCVICVMCCVVVAVTVSQQQDEVVLLQFGCLWRGVAGQGGDVDFSVGCVG